MSLLDTLIMAESNGRNIPNVTDSGPGPGGGYFQIKDGTWNIYARQAGIDLAQFPNALSSPYAIQKQVADHIPMGQWGPRTLRLVRAAGYNYDPHKTLGENIAAVGESGIVPKLSDAGRQLSPQTANLGPAPKGTFYGEDKTAGPFAGATAGATTGAPGSPLAATFANALGGMKIGGDGGGSSGGGAIPPGEAFGLTVPEASPAIAPGADPALAPLASLFTLPTIGQPLPKLNIAAKSWT
jgi:hypothetical protein